MKAHKDHTKSFEELSFSEQAKSISATVSNLGKAVCAHLRKAEEEDRKRNKVGQKCVAQVQRLLARIEKM